MKYEAHVDLTSNEGGMFQWTLTGDGECVTRGSAISPYLAFVAAQEALTDIHAVEPRE